MGAQHQALLHFVAEGMWSDEVVLAKVRDMVLPQIERHGPIEAWILDDTGFPKHGAHSVGVTHQYCGELGKQANCQAAVSLSIANHHASLPVAYRLYLPKSWAQDKKRRTKAGVPDAIAFQTKPKIALDQLARACAADLPRGVVLMDSAYGTDASLRRGSRELGLDYAAAVYARTLVEGGKGNKGKMTAEVLARGLPQRAWKTITWRKGSAEPLRSRFARVRVRARGEGCTRNEPEEWLLVEWPKGETAPTKYWLSFVAEEHRLRPPRRHHHDALAHRARLSGPQAGGRARPLRRARLARLSPPRHHVHRSLRLPDLREGRHSPLGRALRNSPPATCPTPGLQTPRRRRCGLSGTLPTPSPACDAVSSPASHEHCHDVPAVRCHEPAGKRRRNS